MDRNEFMNLLKREGIDPELVAFDNYLFEGFNVRENRDCWDVFYRERGLEHSCVHFPTESDALKYLFKEMKKEQHILLQLKK